MKNYLCITILTNEILISKNNSHYEMITQLELSLNFSIKMYVCI